MADPIIEVVCATEELAKAAMDELVQETAKAFHERIGVLSLSEEEQRARSWYYVEEVDVRA